ncbi:MAG: hypothetical protein KatS3mg105_3767 [Gemmatales bacterium]|nr:MAG: hypothetical protein KatS3mg105_3767 [Gemmatales bacterium]
MTGFEEHEAIGRHYDLLFSAEDVAAGKPQQELNIAAQKGNLDVEGWRVRKDGSRFWANGVLTALYDKGKLTGFVKVTRDLTERRRLEHQLQQAQKMEVIGQLAGGIAHDFNNVLTIILGYAELLFSQVADDDQKKTLVTEISDAAHRAAALTGQLLAFSRKQILEPNSPLF